jgi:hypothetical protein
MFFTGTLETGPRPRGTPEERFWAKVNKAEGCWLWTASKRPNGYGKFEKGRRGEGTVSAHRFSYELHKGPIPNGLLVMHICDTPACVNPDHLRLGTPAENMNDMHSKGRAKPGRPLGNSNFNAVLTPDLVRYIRASAKNNKELAAELGVGINTVRGVRIGRTWTHID